MENEKLQQTAPAAPPAPEGKLPYVAPAIEVIEVRTERGYAASRGSSNDPWSPATW